MIPFLFHPSHRTLTAFGVGEPVNRSRVARHLERCDDCRRFVGFSQRLEKSLGALANPVAGDDLLARALADRAAGARVILPSSEERPRAAGSRRTVGLSAALAAGVAVALFSYDRLRSTEFRGANEMLLAGWMPKVAEAGQGGSAGGALTHHLRPMVAVFQRRFIDSVTGQASNTAMLDLRVAPAAQSGQWLITSDWRDIERPADMSNARAWAETVTVVGTSLAPTRRIVQVTPYGRWAGIHIDQGFRNDSVVGLMSLGGTATRRPIAQYLRGERDRLLVSDALGPMYFMGVPLLPGAEFDVTALGWAVVQRDVFLRMRMRVVGSERITTPAGTFECWKMSVAVGSETHHHWVRKSDHLGVLTRRRLKDGRLREVVLYSESLSR